MSIARKINLQPGELVVEIVRGYAGRQWWQYVIGFSALAAGAFFSSWLLGRSWWGETLLTFAFLVGLSVIGRAVFFHRKNYLVITTGRVVDVSRPSWLQEELFSLDYGQLSGVVTRRRGIAAALFNYGTITLESAEAKSGIEFRGVRQPSRVENVVRQQKAEFDRGRNRQKAADLYQNFLKNISGYTEAELTLAQKKISDRLNMLADGGGATGREPSRETLSGPNDT